MANDKKHRKGIHRVLWWILEKFVSVEVRVEQGVKYLLGPKICIRLGLEISDYLTREFLEHLISSGQVRGFLVKDAVQNTLGEDSSLSKNEEEKVSDFYQDFPQKQREYYLQKYPPKARNKMRY